MKPIARILAATDLSAPARHAVERGFLVATATGARYSVLHALELDTMDSMREWLGDNLDGVKRKLEDQARETLSQQLHTAARDVTADALIALGAPLATIIERADAMDADLLVLGAHGGNFLRHLALGSMASRLLRKTTRHPVLVVKQAPHEPYRRLLLPVDFSPVSAQAIRFARQLAPAADIVLLHTFEAPFEGKLTYAGVEESVIQRYRDTARAEALRHMRLLAEQTALDSSDYTPVVVHGDPSQQIIAQEQELDCDLIVMGKQGTHVTEELLLGSVTKHVLAESQGDVLVICGAR
ncbi:MAG: universal stress protein [Rhodocyclaceae bacterium]|nr:universal stress protein [Rhodocyclaceae bacterium]MDZ4214295.1 universal stress protein [Rhodocyclaceae bacterium]